MSEEKTDQEEISKLKSEIKRMKKGLFELREFLPIYKRYLIDEIIEGPKNK